MYITSISKFLDQGVGAEEDIVLSHVDKNNDISNRKDLMFNVIKEKEVKYKGIFGKYRGVKGKTIGNTSEERGHNRLIYIYTYMSI
jgi:hypothetical protein